MLRWYTWPLSSPRPPVSGPRSRLPYAEASRAHLGAGPEVREAVTHATIAFDRRRELAYAEVDIEAWRTWASAVKGHVLTHLTSYLEQAEERLQANGVTVHWARDAQEACDVVGQIAQEVGARSCVKAKSMLSEEIELNPYLEGRGIQVLETDLGEYILQLLGQPPSHIVGPAIHCSLQVVQELFQGHLNTAADATPEQLAEAARRALRKRFLDADLGISGGNFLVAESGSVVLVENEGNIRLTTSLPPVHIALVGLEKVIPRWSDIGPFLELTSRAATGQPLGMFASVLQGPAGPGDEGPAAVHVVLVDNGRTQALSDPQMWESLKCVRCGACLNTCPVYRQTGGHPYGWVYSGPIGSILAPSMLGIEAATDLPFASTLCGACADVCPVRIPIPELLLEWRGRMVAAGLTSRTEKVAIRAFAAAATRPALFHGAGRVFGRLPTRGPLSVARRSLPMLQGWEAGRAPLRPDRSTAIDDPGVDQ